MKEKFILSFDYGTKRIGVAVGQMTFFTATPLEIVRVVRGIPDWNRIEFLFKEWCPGACVIGLPGLAQDRRTSRSSNHFVHNKAKKFATSIGKRYDSPCFFMDERLSSHCAEQKLGRSSGVDAVAAQVILESWLLEQRRNKMLNDE